MVGLVVLLILLVVFLDWLIPAILLLGIFIFPVILILIIISYLCNKNKTKQTTHLLNVLTSSESLKLLKKEDKKKLAGLVYLYYTNKKEFRQSMQDNLLWIGAGYAASTMGIDTAIRVGIGYTLLNKHIRPLIRKILNKNEKP